jgi:hypothetical protein
MLRAFLKASWANSSAEIANARGDCPGRSGYSGERRRVFESVHISTHIIYAVLTEKALNPFVECASGLLSGEGLSITLKFGRKRSIEHIQSLSELPSLAKNLLRHPITGIAGCCARAASGHGTFFPNRFIPLPQSDRSSHLRSGNALCRVRGPAREPLAVRICMRGIIVDTRGCARKPRGPRSAPWSTRPAMTALRACRAIPNR